MAAQLGLKPYKASSLHLRVRVRILNNLTCHEPVIMLSTNDILEKYVLWPVTWPHFKGVANVVIQSHTWVECGSWVAMAAA